MKKTSTAKNKKPEPAGQQRITTFFSKLSLKKTDILPSANVETPDILPSANVERKVLENKKTKPVIDNDKNEISIDLTGSEEKLCIVKSVPKNASKNRAQVNAPKSPKKQITARKKKSPLKQNIVVITDNSLDDGFVVGKKQNVTSKNKSVYEKLDVIYVEKTFDKENNIALDHKILLSSPSRTKKPVISFSPPLLEKINNLETLDNIVDNIFESTPDKSLLKKNEVLAFNPSQDSEKSSPSDNAKKRKFQSTDSPDFIPATPCEDVYYRKSEIRKSKSKLRIENKFTEVVEEKIEQSSKIIKRDYENKTRTKCALEEGIEIKLTQELEENFIKQPNTSNKRDHEEKIKNKFNDDAEDEDFFNRKSEIRRSKNKLLMGKKNTERVQEKTVEQRSKIIKRYDENKTPTKSVLEEGIKCQFTEKVIEKPIQQPNKVIKIDDEDNTLMKCVLEDAIENVDNYEIKQLSDQTEKLFKVENIPFINNTKITETVSSNSTIKQFIPIVPEIQTLTQTQDIQETPNNQEENVEVAHDFDFDDSWGEAMDNIIEEQYDLNLENWQYCKIISISRDTQQNIIARLQSVDLKKQTNCLIQGVWQYIKLKENDLINIIAIKTTGNLEIPYCVNNNEGFVIFEPDLLISPTSIVSSQFCKRKGILTEKFRGFDPQNKVMIIGTLVHKLLEHVLKNKIYEPKIIEETLSNILSSRDMMFTSYSSQVPLEEIKTDLLQFIPKMVNFVAKFIQKDTKQKKNVPKIGKKPTSDDWQGSIDKIRDIEENIWCTTLGVKGKVDITVETNQLHAVLPLELKTGRASMSLEHRGQVIMYIMMMNECGYNVLSGLLLYLREEVLKEVTTSHREKRDLIMLRNEFAYYMKQIPNLPLEEMKKEVSCSLNLNENPCNGANGRLIPPELPEPINHPKACQMCPYSIICTTYLSQDNSYELSQNHPLKILSVDLLSHLKQSHIDYFLHWTSLINLENMSQNPIKELKHIWRLEPFERESRGRSICYLKVTNVSPEEDNYYVHTFKRTSEDSAVKIMKEKGLKYDFLTSSIVVSNYVVISTDNRAAIATGFVRNITENEVLVSLERNLSERYKKKIFHIDTYESTQNSTFNMTSMAALLGSLEKPTRLRQLIIEKEPSKIPLKCTREVTNLFQTTGKPIMKKLNKIQQRAVLKSLIAEDYLLIKGMPGTGKTATMVALIQLLVLLNKSVLITSHTHSAIDNVCLRLLNCGVDFLRLGSENRVHAQIKHRTESVLTADCKTVKEVEQVYNSAKVIAVTCLSAGHPLLTHRRLDVCIVDESTQVLQCSVIKALLSTKTFILIGDPDQLPPVVRNPEAVRRGMNVSLFERLDSTDSTVTLNVQYRMNKTITKVANSVTYKGELVCADDTIALASLDIPEFEVLSSLYSETEKWVLTTLDTNIQNAVIGINTGPTWNIKGIIKTKGNSDDLLGELQIGAQNDKEDEERRCSNFYEVALVVTLVEALEKAGVQSDSIGIIAPYRAQVELLKKHVCKVYPNSDKHVEVNTVDQYQGRDKNIIIYSCTKSRDSSKIRNNTGFEVLGDKRRLTVAITRAKHKLIIIGDFLTLREYSPFVALLDSLEDSQTLSLNTENAKFNWERVVKCLNK